MIKYETGMLALIYLILAGTIFYTTIFYLAAFDLLLISLYDSYHFGMYGQPFFKHSGI